MTNHVQGKKNRITRNREVRRQWNDMFRLLREKRNKPIHKNFLPKTLFSKNKGKIDLSK